MGSKSKKRTLAVEAAIEEEATSLKKSKDDQLRNGVPHTDNDSEVKKKKKKKKKEPQPERPDHKKKGKSKNDKEDEKKRKRELVEAEEVESGNNKKNKEEKQLHEPWDFNTNPTAEGKQSHFHHGNFQNGGGAPPELHMDTFRELSSLDAGVRKAAALTLVKELLVIQSVYEQSGMEEGVQMEAAKDDCLRNCAPSLRYALRRLIRGTSSSRACARQGFALAFTTVVSAIPCIDLNALVKLIEELLEVLKGQQIREGLLGRLFAYGALVRSGRLESKVVIASDKIAGVAQDITQYILMLAEKKCFMREPAVAIILDLINRVPRSVLLTNILEAPLLKDWLQKDPGNGNPDALLLALKLYDKLPSEMRNLCKILPPVNSLGDLFTTDHMLLLVSSLKESSFCHPRVHSVWQALLDILFVDLVKVTKDPASCHSSEKAKKSQKRNSPERNAVKRLASFWEVVVEGTLLPSSHERKHLAINIFLMLLPRIPASFVRILLSNMFVQCLQDILSAKESHLFKTAQHCLEEVVNWSLNDDERRAAVIIALQINSNAKFDNVSRTKTLKTLVSKFDTAEGSLLFIQKLVGLFLEGTPLQIDKRTYQDKIAMEEEDGESSLGVKSMDEDDESLSGTVNDSDDVLRSWIVDCIYHLSKNAAIDPAAKFPLQKEVLKFLAVQGLFTASLGIEVTSFELQEKLKWPKKPASVHIRRLCIENMQHLLADAQRLLLSDKHAEMNESTQHEMSPLESNDLGAYAMCFLRTLQNIPSVSLFWNLSNDDENTFSKLHDAETQLFQEARKDGHNLSKMQAMRFLLIQLLLQIPLSHGDICEAAAELLICCKEAFGDVIELDVESNNDENAMPVFMDVLIDALLSLLPQSPAPVRVAVQQVFRCFSDNLTESGLINMLQVVKKDLKPPRRKPIVFGDSDEEDPIEIEESESVDEAEESEDEGHSDDDPEQQNSKVQTKPTLEIKNGRGGEDSEDLDSDFDDEAMFRMDTYLAQMFKEKKNAAGSDTAQSQLVHFKLRVLSLLEFYLQRNLNKPVVLTAFSYLLQAFLNASLAEGNEQLADRIGVILQQRIFKAKDYPKGPGVDFSVLAGLLDKVLKLVSRPRGKKVDSLVQTCTFWILKVIHGNFHETKVANISEIFLPIVGEFFINKKCQLKGGFLREVFRRHSWLGPAFFGMLIENSQCARSEYLQIEALSLMDTFIRPWIGKSAQNNSQRLQFLEVHLSSLSKLIHHLLQKQAKKPFRSQAFQFCKGVVEAISLLKLEQPFTELLQLNKLTTCESYIGDLLRAKYGLDT
uniref:DNA polymerase V n=1 Tax=Araucaria cunninghamii TaxID=56994 RepID=A0A0D6QZH6_ARACU